MIIDNQLLLSDSQAVTTTADSTNTIDLSTTRDLGVGCEDLNLLVLITTSFANGTSINFQFMGSADDSTYVVYAETGAITTANLLAGREVLRMCLPAKPGNALTPRYYKMTYTVVGTMNAGKVYATLVPTRQANVAYPPGVTAFL